MFQVTEMTLPVVLVLAVGEGGPESPPFTCVHLEVICC